jgi:hypothetical protein
MTNYTCTGDAAKSREITKSFFLDSRPLASGRLAESETEEVFIVGIEVE